MPDELQLPEFAKSFIVAQNNADSVAFAELFASDAYVHDEQHDYNGIAEIKAWNEATTEKYKVQFEPVDLKSTEGDIVIRIKMTGEFPGSPVEADFHFTTFEGKIRTLKIQ